MLNIDSKKKREPWFHIVKRTDCPMWEAVLFRVGAIVVGLILICLLFFFSSGANPGEVFAELFSGSFGSTRRIWITFRDTSMILLVAIALVPAFKMKFWNLGGNGQILIGALVAISCMYFMGQAGIADWIIILVMIPSSILAGAVWAAIPAAFKAFFNTNESLFTLMMNYIAAGIVAVFLSGVVSSGSGTLSIINEGNLPTIGGNIYLLTIIVSIVMYIISNLYLHFSKHGYELSVVGESSNTAKYIGINVKKVIIRTMLLSGGICGLVGLLFAGAIDHTITTETAKNYGFTSIMVAWLSHLNPIALLFTSFLVAFLNRGVSQAQTAFGISNDSISSIALGLIYFSIIAVEFFISYRVIFRKKEPDDKKGDLPPLKEVTKTEEEPIKTPKEAK